MRTKQREEKRMGIRKIKKDRRAGILVSDQLLDISFIWIWCKQKSAHAAREECSPCSMPVTS